MSDSNTDPLTIARQAEQDLNSQAAKQGHTIENSSRTANFGASDTTIDSGVDASVQNKFPGSTVKIGSEAAPGKGEIPLDEGGDVNPATGKLYKAQDFERVGGPEDKARLKAENAGGDDDVRENIRQGGETRRPPGQTSNDAAGGLGKSTE